jgi:hypothetical protein
VVLSILDFESTERTAILGKSNFALELYAQGLQTIKINLLASSYVNVFCRCIATERVAMEGGNAVGVASSWVFFKNFFFERRLVGAAVGVCEKQ